MCLCSARHKLLRALKYTSGAKLLKDVREGIPDPLSVGRVSAAESSGEGPDKGSAKGIHAEQRGLEFVRCHGVGAVVCALEVYRILDRLNPLLRLLTLQERMRFLRAYL